MNENDQKILRYECFLNQTLKPQLKAILDRRDSVYKETDDYLSLRNIFASLKETQLSNGPIRCKTDLGCGFFMDAAIPSVEEIFVEIGCGVRIAMSVEEAGRYADSRVTSLQRLADSLTDRAAELKSQCRLVVESLKQLQGIPDKDGDQQTEFRL